MKTIMKIVLLIIILTQLISCKSYYGFSKSDLEKNYKFVEYIMNNIDSLYTILSDTSKIYFSSSMTKERIQYRVDNLFEHYNENRFIMGYNYVDDDFKAVYNHSSNTIAYYLHCIKIRSKYNDDIIWFEFTIDEPRTSWKLLAFHFCNNYNAQRMSPELPCDKK